MGSADLTGTMQAGSEGQSAGRGHALLRHLILRLVFQDIEWTHIDYFNNAIICDLIENVSMRHRVLNLPPYERSEHFPPYERSDCLRGEA